MKNAVKLIIEIPKKDYEWAKQIAQTRNKSVYCERQIIAISNGIPLPKGHGRLIDADELYDSLIFPTEQFAKGFKELLDDAPTVIEADEVRNAK